MMATTEIPESTVDELLSKLFLSFDVPFGLDQRAAEVRVDDLRIAASGFSLNLVERAVDNFRSGAVDRMASKRGKLPTGDEFGSYLRRLANTEARSVAGETVTSAPPFGPVWGVALFVELLAGPSAKRQPSAFLAEMIAAGGERGERYRLEHQANNGFPRANAMLQAAGDGKSFTVPTRLAQYKGAMEAVLVEKAEFAEWREEFARRGWPWFPDMGKHPVVWMPCGGPARLDIFKEFIGTPKS